MTILKPLPTENLRPKKLGKFGRRKIVIIFVLLVIGIFLWLMWSSSTAFDFVFGNDGGLKSDNGKVNVLLLGIAGKDHDGPNLTDTIIVASFDAATHKLTLISLPRDLWLDKYKAKVNALYEIGLSQGDSLGLVRTEIGNVLGLSIPYAIRLDFAGFTKAVDLVDGIDVGVTKTFDDYNYPIPGKEDELCGYLEKDMDIPEDQAKQLGVDPGTHKALLDETGKIATVSAQVHKNIDYTPEQVGQYFSCRFEHISYVQGDTKMDGATALKFVRSRHGNNGEGTDFARSKRQQLVLSAFKAKVFSLGTLSDPQKIISLVKTFGDSIDTNISQTQYPGFIKLVKELENTQNVVVDQSGDNPLLVTPPTGEYGAWVLVPVGGDFTKIHQFVADFLSGKIEATQSATRSP